MMTEDNTPKKEEDMTVTSAKAAAHKTGTGTSPKTSKASKKSTALTVVKPDPLLGPDGEVYPVEKEERELVSAVEGLFEEMPEYLRMLAFTRLLELYCNNCGSEQPDDPDEECPCLALSGDEEDDEDEEEDDDTEDSDEDEEEDDSDEGDEEDGDEEEDDEDDTEE